jgi:hypothetical protein
MSRRPQWEDFSVKEYLLRPVDLGISYSMFFPCPPEKRNLHPGDASMSTRTGSKRRKGKREKTLAVDVPECPTVQFSEQLTEQLTMETSVPSQSSLTINFVMNLNTTEYA